MPAKWPEKKARSGRVATKQHTNRCHAANRLCQPRHSEEKTIDTISVSPLPFTSYLKGFLPIANVVWVKPRKSIQRSKGRPTKKQGFVGSVRARLIQRLAEKKSVRWRGRSFFFFFCGLILGNFHFFKKNWQPRVESRACMCERQCNATQRLLPTANAQGHRKIKIKIKHIATQRLSIFAYHQQQRIGGAPNNPITKPATDRRCLLPPEITFICLGQTRCPDSLPSSPSGTGSSWWDVIILAFVNTFLFCFGACRESLQSP